MKDFYRRLGIPPYTSEHETIERAIATYAQDAELVEAARFIMLSPTRKAHYDRVHRVLQTIGQLRANIGITQAVGWQKSGVVDFQYSPTFKPHQTTSDRPEDESSRNAALAWVAAAIVMGALMYGSDYYFGQHSPPRTVRPPISSGFRPADKAALEQSPSFTQPAQPLPANGTISRYNYADPVAPLEIVTRPGGGNYFVRLVTSGTSDPVLDVFVREGQRIEVLVPLGTYELRYAGGTTWYGTKYLFGPETAYAKADQTFTFQQTFGGYDGYTIELFLQRDGNLRTHSIDPDEF